MSMKLDAEVLGPGVILYRNAVDLDWDFVRDFADESADKEMAEMYTPGTDPISGEEGFINRNGYFFPVESMWLMPRHCAHVHQDTRPEAREALEALEKARDRCLWYYLHKYPLAGKCIWWRIKGHILVYNPPGFLGMHSDQSTDYEYGSPHPSDQIATRTVVSTLAFLNDHVETEGELDGTNFTGGLVKFGYLDIEYAPVKGDILVFPSNYLAAHGVTPIGGGPRYSHVGWYCHGTPNPDYNEHVVDPMADPEWAEFSTNVYMPEGYKLPDAKS
jgi:hypothetical protein